MPGFVYRPWLKAASEAFVLGRDAPADRYMEGWACIRPTLAYIDVNSILFRTYTNAYGLKLIRITCVLSSSVELGLIRTVGVMMPGARRAVLGPYGGGLLPPQINDYANKADGLIPCFAGTRAHPYGGGLLPPPKLECMTCSGWAEEAHPYGRGP